MSDSTAMLMAQPRGLRWVIRRVWIPFTIATFFALLMGSHWKSGFGTLYSRMLVIAFMATVAFTFFERFPRRLPKWVARWALQVIAVGALMPITTYTLYARSTAPGAPHFWKDVDRRTGFMMLTTMSMFIAPWTALAALVRQKEAFARTQALAFELQRSELERQALDARLHLLQAQVAPHFLFNTLANVQALVDAGSPQASNVLRSLIGYLRAAVPMLHEPLSDVGREVELARAYLELMHMRIPDRLRYSLDVDPAALDCSCPPTTLLTLVENAVRHGIDPSEEGGEITVKVRRRDGRCLIRVSDSGVGLREGARSLGSGLATLRERMQLVFGEAASLSLTARERGGVTAEVQFPARERRTS